MTRAQLKEQADASLEIISIGSLYSGHIGTRSTGAALGFCLWMDVHFQRRGCLLTTIWHGKRLRARLMEWSMIGCQWTNWKLLVEKWKQCRCFYPKLLSRY
ncbi:uncharacterized protein LOC111458369 [Cucurbita moschata]|uniref:Uncharacterized protein LOC111458369 n=1 Tax=Cucurbita moschata TaxID=3662 RepID=A0A6J1GYN3_CUCMO|nr:uncharacterized protein LOC111458369 [Cucurbita moschata]